MERAMPDHLLSLDEMRERLDRAHQEAAGLIAESRALRLASRVLVQRLRYENEVRDRRRRFIGARP
jgi:hypothetical protein